MDQKNKQRYSLHLTDLNFQVKHSIRIVKEHTVCRITQSPWLAEFNEYNTEERSKAKTKFNKHFYKLIDN